ncbi:MAG: DivIVA domain-containing protein [Desulfocapsa sp.]|nr:DivIVA domain-containing protein [Desulfocapsa sp.]
MTITPQLIKDQEFQVKFRGCDPLEVRDYLENIADHFFELQEKCKKQSEELEKLRNEKESSDDYTGSLETDMEFTRKISDELKDGCSQKEERIKELTKEVDELQLRIADMEQENVERDEEVSEASASVEEAKAELKKAEAENSSLQGRIEILLEQNSDLKKEEVDFKATLASAQRFAMDLKEESKVEAAGMIADAEAEIKKIRDDAHEELERLPVEIEALKKKKGDVKADLKSTLESYLETIEVFYPDDEEETTETSKVESEDAAEENNELFQTIQINDDGSIAPEDVPKLNSSSENLSDTEEALESLFGGDGEGDTGDDAFNLENMFNLEPKKDKTEPSS